MKNDLSGHRVPVEKLVRPCDPAWFKFKSTKDLVPLQEFLGQERAVRALEFGLDMMNDGYNIFVAGVSGAGKTSIVKSYIQKAIAARRDCKVFDWCYVHNFKEADAPRVVSLPQGKGKVFQGQVSALLERIREDLLKAFGSVEYKSQRQSKIDQGQQASQSLSEQLREEAHQLGFTIQMTPVGPAIVPTVKDRPMQQEEYRALRDAARKKIDAKESELRKRLQTAFEKIHEAEHQLAEQLEKADKEIGEYVVSKLFAPLSREYADSETIQEFLTSLKGYTVDNLELFKGEEEPVHPLFGVPLSRLTGGRSPFLPFQVNVFVDNSEAKGPPVVIEPNPNFGNMFGKIKGRFVLGGYLIDHTTLKAGAVSRASGGYLLLNVADVLMNPGVWPAFKRAIKNKAVRIEDPLEQFGLFSPQGLRPEPMPIDVKFVLVGEPIVYQLLTAYDEDFWEIFKVKADFDSRIERTDENMNSYAAFLAGCCEECKARHFDASGVAKVIEYSSRLMEDQQRLSTRFAQIKNLVEEANYWAGRDGKELISGFHVQKAVDEKLFRHNLIEQRVREMITRGIIMIDIEGAAVGQVNGLSVLELGDIAFGKPSRITAKTFLGRAGVIDIERETELSGPIHSKGVMILAGYLGGKYAQDKPLSLSASLCFEQSYEGVEGDSASSAELCAILSDLAGVPLSQSIAVTGSVNQKGEIQPISGVNEKIEGFFDVCRAKGLTGRQGVLIPHRNVVNLMLRNEVVDMVKEGKFHIYSAMTMDEAMEVLTGIVAGECGLDGRYPEGSLNFLVNARLGDMAEKLKEFVGLEENGETDASPRKR